MLFSWPPSLNILWILLIHFHFLPITMYAMGLIFSSPFFLTPFTSFCFALYHRFIFLGCIGLSFIFFCFEFIFVIYFLLLRIYLASVLLYLLSRFDLAKGFLLVLSCFARGLFDFDSSAAFLLHRAFSLHTPRAISFYSAVSWISAVAHDFFFGTREWKFFFFGAVDMISSLEQDVLYWLGQTHQLQ